MINFRVYDVVRTKPLPVSMRHFLAGEAIISGIGTGGFTLFFKGRGDSSWYHSDNLELIESYKPELLEEWQSEHRQFLLEND